MATASSSPSSRPSPQSLPSTLLSSLVALISRIIQIYNPGCSYVSLLLAIYCVVEKFLLYGRFLKHLAGRQSKPKTFGKAAERMRKSSVHSRSIRRVLKAFGKYTESVWKGSLSKSTCGKYSVYSESILKPF